MLGCGSVGSQVVRLLGEQADDLAARVGARVELAGVAVRRLDAPREVDVPAELLTTDAAALVAREDVDLVIEVIGGIEPARSLILSALENGASVVTANKALLAEDGPTLFEAAEKAGRDLYYEAAVAGAIPILRPLRESLAGDRVTRVLGIVNGTTNFILDKMDTSGAGFADALEEAQALGYAEADPTADVEGFDAAAKAAILASLAFHSRVTAADVHREGIADVSAADVRSAREMDSVVKLLAIAELVPAADPAEDPGVSVRVHPAMIPRSHPLASVREAYNAVFVESEAAGQLMFYGPGAGGAPTASAVMGDLVTAARNRLADGQRGARRPRHGRPQPPSGHARRGGVGVRRPGGAADGRDPHPLPRRDRRRRPRGRAGGGRAGIRRARRVDPDRPPGGPGQRRPARRGLARGDGRGARRDRRAPAGHGDRARGHLGDARRGSRGMTHQWRGVIEEYRELLEIPQDTPAVTLREGGTPLVHSGWLSGLTGAEVWLKVEGSNPTGSFKDRGMTTALSVAVHEGAKAVVCASTGNTSASMAAYAAKAGVTPIVLVPEGKISAGKMAQAVLHGSQVIQVRGNFDDCLRMAREMAWKYPVALVNSVNPHRLEGQKTAAFEIVDFLGDAPDFHLLPVGNAGNISAYWLGYTQYAGLGRATKRPVMRGFQAEGAAPLVTGEPFPDPETAATAIRIGNPASWKLAEAARDESGGRFAAVSDAQILAAQKELAAQDGVFVEPASAAGIAGLLAELAAGESYAGTTVAITVTGHGLKDIATALDGLVLPDTVVDADVDAAAHAAGL